MTRILKRSIIRAAFMSAAVLAAVPLAAQPVPKTADLLDLIESKYGILANSVTNLHAHGDSVWVGPFLNLTVDGGDSWQVADADSLFGAANRVFSIDIEDQTIWVGLGFVDSSTSDDVQSAGGFLFSEDGGRSWRFRAAQLDRPGDTTIVYGVSTLSALDVIVPQQSPPFDIDLDPLNGEIWVAGWASGIRRSADNGATWSRVVLPTDVLSSIHPDSAYAFRVEPRRGETGWLNHMGFAVLVDETGTVWAGTPAGVNRSLDGGVSWDRFSSDGSADELTGSWVISIEEQVVTGRNPIWMASWNAGETGESGRFGITVTRDGGETFEQVLTGERVYDFAFEEGYVYAAADNGLFVSQDDGATWRGVRFFQDATGRRLKPDVRVFSVETTPDAVWVGTSDGLVKSTDHGRTWKVFRVDVPVNPDEPSATVPRVDVFAYPNPFSPAADRFVRIRFEADAAVPAELSVFDFGMQLVDRFSDDGQQRGLREMTWDGTDAEGVRSANGVYFYTVDVGGDTFRGKILLIE